MNIERYIDHTVLKQGTTFNDIKKLCQEASISNFVAVCIPPSYVREAKSLLTGCSVKLATVIGFPLGYNTTITKVNEIREAIANGVDELDIVHNVSFVKNGDWYSLNKEITECLAVIIEHNKMLELMNLRNKTNKLPVLVKVIIESGILTDNEISNCCGIYRKHKIDFIKTSTGFAEKGASVHHVELIKKSIPETMGIKASGGIRTYAFAKELIDAGATRIGCSAGIQIMKECELANKGIEVSDETHGSFILDIPSKSY